MKQALLILTAVLMTSGCGKASRQAITVAQPLIGTTNNGGNNPLKPTPTPTSTPTPTPTPTSTPSPLPPTPTPYYSPLPTPYPPVLPPPPVFPLPPCTLKVTAQAQTYTASGYFPDNIEVNVTMLLGNIRSAIQYRINGGGVQIIPANVLDGPIEISTKVKRVPGPNTIAVQVRDINGNSAVCSVNYLQAFGFYGGSSSDISYVWSDGYKLVGDDDNVITGAGAGDAYGYWFLQSSKIEMPPLVGHAMLRTSYCDSDEVMVGRKAGNPDAWSAANDILCKKLDPRLETYLDSSDPISPNRVWQLGARAYGYTSNNCTSVVTGFLLTRNARFGIRTACIRWKQ